MAQPLSPNEIRDRALRFSRDWEDVTSEKAEAQTFWNEFFEVFGRNRKRLARFEERVEKAKARWERDSKRRGGFIDLFWPGTLIAEHKSAGKDLDTAYEQALGYFDALPDRDLPRYVIVSDFARIRLYDLEARTHEEFPLRELHKKTGLFGFISGYTVQNIKEQDPVNIKAAEKMGRLHDQLKSGGYVGHDLEVLLVRLLFCLFAEDTTIFNQKDEFRIWIENCTREDGSDLGSQLSLLFQVLNTPEGDRQKELDERFASFPHVNGKLFAETLPIASFNSKMREALLDCCALDWGRISPAIFGALFQSVMDEKARRNLGAHYTSEENILKLIKPLFLDELRQEFEKVKKNRNRLFEFHKKISLLRFMDPACGCGNFLVVAYRELRLLELDILRATRDIDTNVGLLGLMTVNVDQFYGIEIEEFPAQIAQVALWLMDHQMNMKVSEEFGFYYRRLPLKQAARIVHGNALQFEWEDVVPHERLTYLLGNPPFVGKKEQSEGQKSDMDKIFGSVKGAGVLDFVAAWYVLAAKYIQGTHIRCAFVSTNSITQGEQVGILWAEMYRYGAHIQFAHRTFKWSNEARGKAAVHCVIVGFGLDEITPVQLFDYDKPDGDAHLAMVKRINPYLVDAPEVFLSKRGVPISPEVREISYGSMPIDEGHLILSDEERIAAIKAEPILKDLIKRYYGGEEFINNIKRWCIWLVGVSPQTVKESSFLKHRIELCRNFRLSSGRAATQALAKIPGLFGEIRQPTGQYLLIPKVSSESRAYIPIGFLKPDAVASGTCLIVPNATLYDFGVLTSQMHMAWMRAVAGRMKSDYQYSNGVVYNNFPWPELSGDGGARSAIEKAAEAVLDERGRYPEATLADLYDQASMPAGLAKAHATLDRLVDRAYRSKGFNSDAERVAHLFELYQKYTTLLPAGKSPGKDGSHGPKNRHREH